MWQLRNYGVYQPPGGLRPVLAVRAGSVYYLYDKTFGPALPPRFRVEPGGSITNWHGDPVDWTAEDLVDTGETRDIDIHGVPPHTDSDSH
jgi:hypothetical protein